MIENKLLVERLSNHWYWPHDLTLGLWKHDVIPVTYFLTVDDFGVKYVEKEHVTHIVEVLQQYLKIVIDWEGNIYCGLTLY